MLISLKNLSADVIEQYQTEERTTWLQGNRKPEAINGIAEYHEKGELSENYKVKILRDE